VDVFTRNSYRELIIQSLLYCINHKKLQLHAWVLMTNHLHLIASSTERLEFTVRDFKKFTSKQMVETIKNNRFESRREWMINLFAYSGMCNPNNKTYQFWKQDYHPVILDTSEKFNQRLHYLHENPVRAGFVSNPVDYPFSSAADYQLDKPGKLPLVIH